ncbi:MAG: DEAD/DEAH box helicase [Verrucomicrobiae bacterium]|nr:DEAD/DEAH box helicase [Verrucomicrobiae bacterium]
MSDTIHPNTRVIHREHAEYGFGLVRYVEENAFGDARLQVAFDHLDHLENVAPDEVEAVGDPGSDTAAGHWGDVSTFRRKLSAGLIIGENNLTGGFTKSAVQPLPHQAFLLDKVLSAERFGHVLADDVGLGKTIEAGLLITCLIRREPPQRIMVVCPAGLALQWQDEMEEHFGLNFSIMGDNFDGKRATSWRTQSLVIAPIDRLKRDEYRELLKQTGGFDLVVCDEAHRLTARRQFLNDRLVKTANYRLFEFLVQSRLIRYVENNDQTPRSPRLLLLSATPHQGDDERFLHLLHLARPDLFDPTGQTGKQLTTAALVETLTRTPKSRAVDWEGKPVFKGHETKTLDVRWTVEETAVSRLLTEYILKSLDFVRDSDRGTQLVVQLVMHTFHKIAASSWPALERALRRRLESLDGRAQKLGELLEDEDENADEAGRDFALPAKVFFDNEKALLETLLARIADLPRDSKWEQCADLLRQFDAAEPEGKVLVFTQYRRTQEMLGEKLARLFPGVLVELVHGDVDVQGRQQARYRFENESRFLISTEAGGEGVNLQKACHVMLNYDLPWNPMRLQQRIGRLDRYGQKQVVQVFNLRVPDSWDQQISTRILERLAVIQHTMGLAGAGLVEDYREMILGEIAEHLDVGRLFAESRKGDQVKDGQVDEWIFTAVKSVERWRSLFSPELGMGEDTARLKPTLTSDDLKMAFRLACEARGIQLRETRNSRNQFVPGVFNFELPTAFRDPVFRPSRTMHVVFDRNIYAAVRGQDWGTVRGQPIRPVLCGFGEPFTDWAFQAAVQAAPGESAFAVKASRDWTRGSGWLAVYALRWLGPSRRLRAPDSIAGCWMGQDGNPVLLPFGELAALTRSDDAACQTAQVSIPAEWLRKTRMLAQEQLRQIASGRSASSSGNFGISLWAVVRITDS